MACLTPAPRLTLWFTKPTAQTTAASVNSLRIAETSQHLAQLVCQGTDNEADTGALELRLSPERVVDEDSYNLLGYAFKAVLNDNSIEKGPVVVGVRSNSDRLTVSGGSAGAGGATGYRFGLVTLSISEAPVGMELPVDLVRLDGTTEEYYDGVLALGFPAGRLSSLVGRIRVPASLGSVTTVTLQWRGWLMARANGSLPDLELAYQVVPAADPATPTALPGLSTRVTQTLDLTGLPALSADEYVEVATANITTGPGDIVLFSLTRDDSAGDGFDGDVFVIYQYVPIISAE